MKGTLYPIRKNLSLLRRFFIPLLFLVSAICTFSNATAKTVVIGSGSGTISQTSMSGLSAGDVLAITPGTYSSAVFSNLNNITITNNGGTVTFTGNSYTEIGSNNTNLTITGLNYQNINSDAFLLTGTNIQGFYIYHCTFTNVTNYIIDAGGYATTYNGNVSTLKVYRCAINNCKFTKCGPVWQGGYGTPSQNQDLCDSVTMAYDTVTNTATNGTEVAGMISHLNIHHWLITYNGNNPVSGDVGVFQTAGDGQIHDCVFKGGRGYLSRQLLYGLNGVGSFYFYNNIIYGQNAYGAIDIRCDSSNYGSTNPYLKKANAWIYNCTMGNKTDVNGYVCPVVIVGIMGAAGGNATCTIRNLFAFNNQYGANPIANNNANGTWAIDTANNIYADAAHALLYLQDTNSTFMPIASSPLNTKGVAMGTPYLAIPDIWGFGGSGNRVGAVFYNSGGHSVTANAGSNQTITLPLDSVSLSGSASTVFGSTISSYTWIQASGPNTATLSSPATVGTKARGLIAGTYVFSLKVTDANGDVSTATVTITVNAANQPPVVSAGSDQTITLPTNSVTLTGTATDILGISSYLWTQTSGPNTASIGTSGALKTTVSGMIAGTYVFQLKVLDLLNLSSLASVNVIVNPAVNQPPVVSAGNAQIITLPVSSVTLTGSATDATGTISSYLWTQVSGPNTASFTNASSTSTTASGLVTGVYVFQLKATDNGGLSGTANVTITVNLAVNQPPIVSAGTAQTITLPVSSVTLTGSATDATGTISSYLWAQVSGPNTASFTNASSTSATASGLIAGTYVFQLKATDNGGLTGTANVTITVNPAVNQPPVVSAGTAQTITLPVNSVTLTGTATDATGTISSYLWAQVSGPGTANILTSSAIKTNVTGLLAGTYVFQLKATDNGGLSATANVTITVNPAPNQLPTASAGANQTITLPVNSVTLDGSASKDADGTIASYSWTKISGPTQGTIVSAGSVTTVVNNLVQGTYLIKLTVKDNSGATASDTVTITVNAAPNQSPLANAGVSKTITLPVNSTSLDGSGSNDPDGTIASYAWAQISGPSTATISGASTATPTVSALLAGQYVFQLLVTDNKGATATAQVKVIVNPAVNQPPTASAGSDQTITLPVNSVTLDGSSSKDPDGVIVSFAWTKISGPAQGTIASANNVTTAVNNLAQGTYIFKLTVTDNSGATGTDSLTITVNPAPNQPPVANAGASKTITLPVNSVSLDGTKSSDADGTIASYSWIELSGPSTATITGGSTATPTASALVQGQYVFQLTVTDNSGASAVAEVNVTVNPAANVNPIANAGANQTITLPVDSVTVDGSASIAPSGSIVSYSWANVSGPSQVNIVSPNNASTLIDNLAQGIYIFQLTVKDNNGNTDIDSLTVIVNAAVNKLPVANAGTSKTIILPLDSVVLDGTKSSDPDGTIASYSWVEISGPSTAVIANANTATPTASALLTGRYTFQLTVTDNSGATSKATVRITVIAAPNQAPVANAGANINITLPVSTVTVDGSASQDADGTIASYTWSKVSGPASGTIANPSSANTAINNLAQGVYVFKLTVTDNNGATSSDNVTVTVNAAPNQPPVANAGASQTITLPLNSTSLDGTKSSDADGTIASYSWVELSGPSTATITGASTATPSVSALVAGQYVFQLTVTDNNSATSVAQVNINVLPAADQPPVADAGTNQTMTLPTSTANLDGSNSYDPDGTIASYSWSKASGTGAVTITNSTTAKPTISGLQAGQYVFKLTVADNKGATGSAQVMVTVNAAAVINNKPPVANAGSNQAITLPLDSVTLDGSKSTDADGSITYYSWSEAAGSAGINISNPNTINPEITGLQVGQYIFELIVTDDKGATDTAQVTITVKNAPASVINQPPVANAGKDTTIALPANSAILNGSASNDPDGTIALYSWAQISGPGNSVISSSGSATTKVNSLAAGVYTFQLTVTDNQGATSTDTVKVTVQDNSRTSTSQAISLYPNPTLSSSINLQITSTATGTMMVFIYDVRGKIAMVRQYSKPATYFSTPINLSMLYGGTYTLQAVIAKKTVMIAKFVKQ